MQNTVDVVRQSEVLEKKQQYREALKLVHEARVARPQDRPLAIRQAQLFETTRQLPMAIATYKQLIDDRPELQEADLVIGLARCLLKSAQYEQAAKMFSQVQEKLPHHPEVLVGLASCRRHKGALDDAEKMVRQVLAAEKDHKAARHELAQIQIAKKQDEAAVASLEANVLRGDIFGDSLDLWLETLKRLNRDRYAQETLEGLIKQHPKKVEFIFAHAVLAHRAGEVALARPAFEKANELSPNNYRILHEWGVMERMAGDTARSQELIGQSLALKPDQPAALRTFGTDYKYSYGDPVFMRLNAAAAGIAEAPALDQVQLHYALGKAFEDVSELDTAYRHFAIAGAKKRKLENYPERNVARMFQVIPKVVNAKNLAVAPQAGCQSEVPVFILGMPRSGTSLMEQILSSHPDVFGAGELKFMTGVVDNIQVGQNRLRLNDAEAVFPYDDNASWERRGQRYVDKLEQLADKPYKRIVDKMPGNFTIAGLIHAVLPKARIIHSRRHPIETCLSCYRIHFAEGQQWSYNLRELGRYYKRYWTLMKHWRSEFPDMMLEIRYEENVADVETQAKRLIDYLGLDWHEGCLEFYNTDRPVKTASATQVRKPIYKTSTAGRWKKYEKHLGPLIAEIGDIVAEYEAEIAHLDTAG